MARLKQMESENAKYEDELLQVYDELKATKEKLHEVQAYCTILQHMVEHPVPPCDFGTKGDKWSYKVFGLACELLCIRLTAEQCRRVSEIFLRFCYPQSKVRVPLQKTFEKWRSMMYRIVKYVNVRVRPPSCAYSKFNMKFALMFCRSN